MDRTKTGTAVLCIIIAAVLWGIIGLFTKSMGAIGLTAVQITFLRCAVAGAAIWVVLAVRDRSLLKIRLKDIWIFLGTGILSISFFNILYFTSIEETSLSVAAMLLYTAPCFVMLFSALFFKEKITKFKIAGLILAAAGCYLITMPSIAGSKFSFFGVITGIGSGVCYALYSIFGNVAVKRYSTGTILAYTFLFATLFLIPLCGEWHLEPGSDFKLFGLSIGIGIVAAALPYYFYTKGLKTIKPVGASVIAFIEPVVATLVGMAFFAEKMTFPALIGIILIFASTVIISISLRNGESNE